MRTSTLDPVLGQLTRPDGLADRLRQLRQRTGLSGKSLAAVAGWQPSKVSRIEHGRQRPTATDIEVWTRACGADPETTAAMLTLLNDLESIHRDWKLRLRRGQPPVQADSNHVLADSSLIRHFEIAHVPGLLQTADYARRVLAESADLRNLVVTDLDEAVATRMQCQQLLYDTGKSFEFLLAEPVLRWLLCPPEVMAAQLDRLQTAMSLPTVRFGIVPFDVQLPVTPQNSFRMYDDLAIVETFLGETVYRGPEAEACARVMDRLWSEAVTGARARRLIVRAIPRLTAK